MTQQWTEERRMLHRKRMKANWAKRKLAAKGTRAPAPLTAATTGMILQESVVVPATNEEYVLARQTHPTVDGWVIETRTILRRA